MRRVLCALCAVVPFALSASQSERVTARFLDWGGAAAAVGMGEAVVALPGQAEAMAYNPSAMAQSGGQLSLGYQRLLADANGAWFGAVTPLPWGVVGVDFRNVDYGAIDDNVRDSQGNIQTRSIRPSSQALSLGWGMAWRDFGGFAFGVAGTWWGEDFGAGRQTGVAVSGGVRLPLPWNLSMGVAMNHWGNAPDGSPLPSTLRTGLAWEAHQLGLGADWVSPRSGSAVVDIGARYRLEQIRAVVLRCGYQLETSSQSGDVERGLSLGFGAGLAGLGIDYAFVPSAENDATHRISLTWEFGRSR